jgi:glucose 1-dehydrogenase
VADSPHPTDVPGRFAGKRFVMSGGGRGIGEATARRAAREGADVLLISRTRSEIEAVAESIVAAGGQAWWHVADVAADDQVEAAVDAARDRWGGIDVLVNCAGFGFTAPFIDFPISEWRTIIDVNLTGAFMMAQRVARVMIESGGGSVVHISSIAGLAADGDEGAYNASKAGMRGLNNTMARELARYGIRSNLVAPGYTATPLTRDFLGPKTFDYVMNDFDRIPQRRMATSEEIGSAILYLASDDASAVNGCELVVDGGMMANAYVVETLPPA